MTPSWSTVYTGPTKENERGVKGLKVLAVVHTPMSKKFWDNEVLEAIKGEEICKDKCTGRDFRGKQHIGVSYV